MLNRLNTEFTLLTLSIGIESVTILQNCIVHISLQSHALNCFIA